MKICFDCCSFSITYITNDGQVKRISSADDSNSNEIPFENEDQKRFYLNLKKNRKVSSRIMVA
jgi:hypothetical protein